ncbi:MAG: STM4011 family radical SAM protein [Candidatus Methylacidiphilales bacterium]|nr:STM4011 family radical SAM protein [Candidatus Methylacidiphilales bacterium]
MKLSILYRGPLSSCDYACGYCPFAKTRNTAAELADDAARLRRFVGWTAQRSEHSVGILFTPWGEALIRRHYRDALTELSWMPHVRRVAVQTNLSARLGWLGKANPEKLALWCTYHPSQVKMADFVAQCSELARRGFRYSVGIVGLKENFDAMQELRQLLPADTYLWVNAYKRVADYYSPSDVTKIEAIDPLFGLNNQYHRSLGEECAAGETAFSLDGDGNMYRCHFIKRKIGNIYEGDNGMERALKPRLCENTVCGCHIGYVHMKRTGAEKIFGEGILERIPVRSPKELLQASSLVD